MAMTFQVDARQEKNVAMNTPLDGHIQSIESFAILCPDEDGTQTTECANCHGKLPMAEEKILALPARNGDPCCCAECRVTINALL